VDKLVTSPEEYIAFLDEVWQARSDSKGDSEVVYSIFYANLDKFNQILVELYPNWANNILSQAELEKARNVAVNFLHFSNLIRQFPLNKNASKQEIAIIGYKLLLNLKIFTLDKFREAWAITQKNLGLAYSDEIIGDQTKAISCYKRALEVYTRDDFPEDWAKIQNLLGLAYFEKNTGDETKNINAALGCYKSALEVYSRDDFPQEWARTQKNLGLAYFKKTTGETADNMSSAIYCYDLALKVYTYAGFPEDWAATHKHLGDAYLKKGWWNEESAIVCYERALEVYTRVDFPKNWARIQNNLGDAYFKKSTGNQDENIDAAVTCYKLALEVLTCKDFPESLAKIEKIENNLETAYKEKITRAEDIDATIAYYQEALEVFTPTNFPKNWAKTQNNLGLAYFKKITGNRDENIDTAIACFEKALEVDDTSYSFRKYRAEIQNNLITAYKEKITGNRAENIDTDVKKLKHPPEYSLNQCSQETGFTEPQLTQWKNAINRKGQTIIQGPPGTGKTFIAEKLAKHLISGGDGFSDIIQFHPAYTYEDFIEGLRPTTKNGQLTYSIVPGRFLQFCEKAEDCEDTCVLIIDEINRANLSQVFGELMYLLDERENTERCIILASGQQFKIPTNVRIIGTMNTADRSIALVDNALRRRFAFIPISPNYELLENYHNREETDFPFDKLIVILKEVNQAINNKHYELGISFFLTKTLAEDIQDIWQMEIEPYLEEYFFDNQKKMDEFLWNKIEDKLRK